MPGIWIDSKQLRARDMRVTLVATTTDQGTSRQGAIAKDGHTKNSDGLLVIAGGSSRVGTGDTS
jgi:hypothetical protein